MEDRIAEAAYDGRRPGWALVALVAILLITAAWWALALWPASAEPEWLARTRAACFGSKPGGLPDTSGWILLIGEPIGMLGVLAAIGGRSLLRDFAWLRARPLRRAAAIAATAAMLILATVLGVRVARAWEGGRNLYALDTGVLRRADMDIPGIALVDQHGRAATITEPDGGPAIVSFAFGHCATVCPVIVSELRAARGRAGRGDIPLVIVTLDPWRDTPERLATLAASWQLSPHDRVLSGGIAEVNATLDSLGVARRRNYRTGDVDHVTTVFLVGREGHIDWREDGGVSGVEEALTRM